MKQGVKLLTQMVSNPQGDWTISDIERVCRAYGLYCEPPRGGGSHYKIASDQMDSILTVPFRKPIKTVYIKAFIRVVEGHAHIKIGEGS